MPTATYLDGLSPRIRARMEARDARLKAMGFKSYDAYLASPLWAKIRGRYRMSNLPQDCVLCGAIQPILLHHRTYERVGDEELSDLVPLCPTCHADVHALEARGEIELGDVEQLKSPTLAALYKPDKEARAQRLEQMSPDRTEDDFRRRLRRVSGLLRSQGLFAFRQGRDIEEELRLIEQAVESIESKNSE